MKFSPAKIEPKVLEKFIGKDGLHLGTILNLSDNDFVSLIDKWVSIIDNYIIRTKKYSPFYIELFSQRGVTFEEYQKLFLKVDPENFKRFAAFEYFMITDKTQLASFCMGKEPTVDGFVKTIKKEMDKGNLNGLQTILQNLQAQIPVHALQTHAYISGATGTGKSELLKLLLYKLSIENNSSIILIDPHGDLAKETYQLLIQKYPEKVVYIDPFLKEGYSPVINPLEITTKNNLAIDIAAQNLSSIFCELLPNELSLNMKTLLVPCISVLLKRENSTLQDLQKLIKGDKELLDFAKANAGYHRMFFDNFNDGLYSQTKSALFTKLQNLLNSYTFFNCTIGQSSINIENEIRKGKIILCNLNKGKMGEEHSQAFGKFIMAKIKNKAMQQDQYRKQNYLFIDEAHNFVSESMETIITEARKYKLSLIMANQYPKQLGKIEETVLSNVGAIFTGANNNKEAFNKIPAFSNTNFQQLQKLQNYQFHITSKKSRSFVFQVSDELVNNEYKKTKVDAFNQFNSYYQKNSVLSQEVKEPKKILPKFGLG